MFLLIDGNDLIFRAKSIVDFDYYNDILHLLDVNLWNDSVLKVPKLRAYVMYKEVYHTEEYSISQEICTRFLLCCALLRLYID